MKTVVCFVSNEMADFEVTLTLQILKNIGKRKIVTAGYELSTVVGQTGFTFQPDITLVQAAELLDVEALIIPGGPIRAQGEDLTELIRKIYGEQKLVAAICFGPQYLGRAGVLDHHQFTTSCSEETIQSLQVPDPYPRSNYVEARVVRDRNVITAKGGAFVDFAFAIASYLDAYVGNGAGQQRFYNEIMDRAAAVTATSTD